MSSNVVVPGIPMKFLIVNFVNGPLCLGIVDELLSRGGEAEEVSRTTSGDYPTLL